MILLPARTFTLTALSTTATYQEASGWNPTIGAVRARAVLACAENSGNFEFSFAIQTATTDTEVANAPVILGIWQSTVNRFFRDSDIIQAGNGDVNNHFFFRFLIGYRIKAGGGTMERGTITLLPGYRS